ncbi:MAG: hypothetical protein ABI416_08350 [Ginsengibacter sp.]
MKKKEKKELKNKLIVAVKNVLTTNNAILTSKIEKAVEKSINLIVKKSQKKNIAKRKTSVAA